MDLQELLGKFNRDSIFLLHEDGEELLEHLLKGTKTQAEISRLLGISESGVCQYKKQINKYLDELKPLAKALVKEQRVALAETADPSAVMSLEDLGEKIQNNIDECSLIINNAMTLLPYNDDTAIAFQHLRLKAMDKLEKSISIYFDRYGSLSEVKASAELKRIKEKVEDTVTFLLKKFPDNPEAIQEYIKFLDEKEDKEEKTDE